MSERTIMTIVSCYAAGVARAKARQPSEPNQPPAYYAGYHRQLKRNPIVIYADGRKVYARREEADEVARLLTR